MKDIRWLRAPVLALATVVALAISAPVANANTGDVLRDLPNQPGTGVAFDGSSLYSTDTGGLSLDRVSTSGTLLSSTPITGAAGLQAITYDATRGVFWGVDSTGLTFYTLDKSGLALLQFAVNPATDLPGTCGSVSGCSTTIAGLAYDSTDDSLWFLPSGSTRIYHLDTGGNSLGYVDIASIGCAGATGIAAAADSLYVSACGKVLRVAKTDTGASSVASSFAAPGTAAGDVACDDVTFAGQNADAVWIRDAATNDLRAVQIANNSCVYGGGVAIDPTKAWMTGGGSFNAESTVLLQNGAAHLGFMLHCTSVDGLPQMMVTPNTLTVTWGKGNSFHLDTPGAQTCSPPPTATPTTTFNTITGTGSGKLRLNGQLQQGGGTASWTFNDNADPGNGVDTLSITIEDVNHTVVLDTPFQCDCTISGNIQAHQLPG